MSKNKNKKSFQAIMKKSYARLYRIKQNHPIFIGDMVIKSFPKSTKERDQELIKFLKHKNHILQNHKAGEHFTIVVV